MKLKKKTGDKVRITLDLSPEFYQRLEQLTAMADAETVARLPQQVVLVTHHLDLLADFDRVLVFDERRLVHDGPPQESVKVYRELMA